MSQEKENPLWSGRWALMAVIILYALVHLPFVGFGFGEPDAWRNGLVALSLAQGLGWGPNSRVPGFPVVELSFGLLAKLVSPETLWIYTNLLTLLISLMGMYIYFKIALYHRISHPLIPVLLLYFIPVVFINAAFSMDNLWAMTFLLMTYWFLLQAKPFWASLFFALAIGSRLTSAIFLFPFLVCLVWNRLVFPKKESLGGAVWLLTATFVLGIIYVGLNWNTFGYLKENIFISRDYIRSGYYFLQQIFGLPGTLILIGMIIWGWGKFPSWNWDLSFLIMVVFLYAILFLYRPEKPSYFIPVLPFLVLWICRWLKEYGSYLLTGLIILNNIVAFVVVHPTPEGLTLQAVGKGIAWDSYHRYQCYKRDADFIIHYPYPPDTKVEAGFRHPGVLFLLELPAYQHRKQELLKNRIVFPEVLDKEKRRNTYWVSGSLSYKIERQFLASKKYQVIYLPSTRTGP